MADPDIGSEEAREDAYDPSEVEATRMREQGGGLGQRDMDRQQDPTRAAEQPHFQSTVDIGDPDEPASGGMQQGATHTRWEDKDETWGQGRKTLAAQRDQQKRST